MEAWREELYHGLFTNSDGSWKQHKYIRKEGNRYIYPEDLKKTITDNLRKYITDTKKRKRSDSRIASIDTRDSKLREATKNRIYQNHGVVTSTAKRYAKDKEIKRGSFKTLAKLKYKNDVDSGDDIYERGKARKVRRQIEKAIKKGKKTNNTGDPNSTYASHYRENTQTVTTYKASIEYKNGKAWFDRMTVSSSITSEPALQAGVRDSKVYEDKYVYEYGKLHQLGKSFVNKLFGNKKG